MAKHQSHYTIHINQDEVSEEAGTTAEGEPPAASFQYSIRGVQLVFFNSALLIAAKLMGWTRLLSLLATQFSSIPITANAYVSRMKWVDWSEILVAKQIGSSVSIPFKGQMFHVTI